MKSKPEIDRQSSRQRQHRLLPCTLLYPGTFGNPLTVHKQSFVCLYALHTWIVAHSTFIHMLKDPSRLSVPLCQRLRCASLSCRYSNIFHWQISQFSTFIPFSFLAAGHGPKHKRFSFTYCSFTQPQPLCLCSPPSCATRRIAHCWRHFPISAQWQLMCKTLIRFVKCAPTNCRLDFPRKMLSNCCHKTSVAFLFACMELNYKFRWGKEVR